MGLLQFSEIRDEIASTMGARGNVDNTRRGLWVNLAYHNVCSAVDFEELNLSSAFVTADTDWDYSILTRPLSVEYVRNDTDDKLLTWIPRLEFHRLKRGDSGTPLRWTREAEQIFLHPTPSGILNMSVKYKQEPAKMTGDTDVTILPAYMDEALLLIATARGLGAVGEDQRAILWLNQAITYLQSRVTDRDFRKLIEGLEKTRATLEVKSGQ